MEKGYPEQIPDVEGLISGHMDLVRKIAWHMHGRVGSAIEIDDLIQIGYFYEKIMIDFYRKSFLNYLDSQNLTKSKSNLYKRERYYLDFILINYKFDYYKLISNYKTILFISLICFTTKSSNN